MYKEWECEKCLTKNKIWVPLYYQKNAMLLPLKESKISFCSNCNGYVIYKTPINKKEAQLSNN